MARSTSSVRSASAWSTRVRELGDTLKDLRIELEGEGSERSRPNGDR